MQKTSGGIGTALKPMLLYQLGGFRRSSFLKAVSDTTSIARPACQRTTKTVDGTFRREERSQNKHHGKIKHENVTRVQVQVVSTNFDLDRE